MTRLAMSHVAFAAFAARLSKWLEFGIEAGPTNLAGSRKEDPNKAPADVGRLMGLYF